MDFAILHFSTPDPKNPLSGPVWDPQILQNRSRNTSRGAQVAPRWRPNRPLDPQDGRLPSWKPSWSSKNGAIVSGERTTERADPDFGCPGPILPPIWRSQASFWTPRSQFSGPQAPIFQPRLPFAPVPHACKPPILQKRRGGMRGASELILMNLIN